MDYQTLINALAKITFSYIGRAGKFVNLMLNDESTADDVIEVLKDATGCSAFADTQEEQQVLATAFVELKELMSNHDDLEVWKGVINVAKEANSNGTWLVSMGKELSNGISGSSLVNALSGSISS